MGIGGLVGGVVHVCGSQEHFIHLKKLILVLKLMRYIAL
jgi:hypothetical protein